MYLSSCVRLKYMARVALRSLRPNTSPISPTRPAPRQARARALPEASGLSEALSDGTRLAGHVLGGFVLVFSSLQFISYKKARTDAENIVRERERAKCEYEQRVKNNMRGFEDVPEDDEL